MWAGVHDSSPTAATATTWSAGTTGTVVIVVELPSSILADLYGGADNTLDAEYLFEPPPERPLATLPTLPRAPRQRAPRGRDPRLLRHALARMRRAA